MRSLRASAPAGVRARIVTVRSTNGKTWSARACHLQAIVGRCTQLPLQAAGQHRKDDDQTFAAVLHDGAPPVHRRTRSAPVSGSGAWPPPAAEAGPSWLKTPRDLVRGQARQQCSAAPTLPALGTENANLSARPLRAVSSTTRRFPRALPEATVRTGLANTQSSSRDQKPPPARLHDASRTPQRGRVAPP